MQLYFAHIKKANLLWRGVLYFTILYFEVLLGGTLILKYSSPGWGTQLWESSTLPCIQEAEVYSCAIFGNLTLKKRHFFAWYPVHQDFFFKSEPSFIKLKCFRFFTFLLVGPISSLLLGACEKAQNLFRRYVLVLNFSIIHLKLVVPPLHAHIYISWHDILPTAYYPLSLTV